MLTNIQALRAIAALMVLLYHAITHLVSMDDRYSFLLNFSKYGYIGVDIFFVISGYVISLTTTSKPRNLHSAIEFTKKRSARIYLGYWPFLLVMFLILINFDPSSERKYHLLTSLFLYTNRMNYLLPSAWSLTYELYFYLILLPVFFVPQKYLRPLMLSLFLIILYINVFGHFRFNGTRWFLTNPYLLEFFSGAIFYHYQSQLARKKYLWGIIPAAIAGFAIGAFHDYEQDIEKVLTFGVFSFGLFWIFMILEKEKLFLFGKIGRTLGDASYTIYLAHLPFLSLFYSLGIRDWLHLQHPLLILGVFILLIGAILFFSVQFYRFVEAPLYYRISHRRISD